MIQNHSLNPTPPRDISQLSIIVKVKELYRFIYQISFKIEKKNRYGIHKEIEAICLQLLKSGVEASLSPTIKKLEYISKMRINIENLKHLVRLEYELKIIPAPKYLSIEEMLVELSKMSLGWERSAQKRPENSPGRF